MLSHYTTNNAPEWDKFLPYVIFAYNTAKQESLGFAPFYLLYGRNAHGPNDINTEVE